ncbi:MAG: S-layer homology domain-containing protein [Clostridia bacterium]|nr:S-layer homology domain-containing protein [Clostridia bacterium]
MRKILLVIVLFIITSSNVFATDVIEIGEVIIPEGVIIEGEIRVAFYDQTDYSGKAYPLSDDLIIRIPSEIIKDRIYLLRVEVSNEETAAFSSDSQLLEFKEGKLISNVKPFIINKVQFNGKVLLNDTAQVIGDLLYVIERFDGVGWNQVTNGMTYSNGFKVGNLKAGKYRISVEPYDKSLGLYEVSDWKEFEINNNLDFISDPIILRAYEIGYEKLDSKTDSNDVDAASEEDKSTDKVIEETEDSNTSSVVTESPVIDGNISSWAVSDVKDLEKLDVFDQERFKNFKEPITRLEFIYFAAKLFENLSGKEIEIDPTIKFIDTDDIWAYKGATVGITSGIGEQKFGPEALLSREQFATMIIKTLTLGNLTLEANEGYTFKDDDQISSWAKESMYLAKQNGIISGVGNDMSAPKGNATLEQSLVILNKIIDNFSDQPFNYQSVSDNVNEDVSAVGTWSERVWVKPEISYVMPDKSENLISVEAEIEKLEDRVESLEAESSNLLKQLDYGDGNNYIVTGEVVDEDASYYKVFGDAQTLLSYKDQSSYYYLKLRT